MVFRKFGMRRVNLLMMTMGFRKRGRCSWGLTLFFRMRKARISSRVIFHVRMWTYWRILSAVKSRSSKNRMSRCRRLCRRRFVWRDKGCSMKGELWIIRLQGCRCLCWRLVMYGRRKRLRSELLWFQREFTLGKRILVMCSMGSWNLCFRMTLSF